jgi:hypothetical protein
MTNVKKVKEIATQIEIAREVLNVSKEKMVSKFLELSFHTGSPKLLTSVMTLVIELV